MGEQNGASLVEGRRQDVQFGLNSPGNLFQEGDEAPNSVVRRIIVEVKDGEQGVGIKHQVEWDWATSPLSERIERGGRKAASLENQIRVEKTQYVPSDGCVAWVKEGSEGLADRL